MSGIDNALNSPELNRLLKESLNFSAQIPPQGEAAANAQQEGKEERGEVDEVDELVAGIEQLANSALSLNDEVRAAGNLMLSLREIQENLVDEDELKQCRVVENDLESSMDDVYTLAIRIDFATNDCLKTLRRGPTTCAVVRRLLGSEKTTAAMNAVLDGLKRLKSSGKALQNMLSRKLKTVMDERAARVTPQHQQSEEEPQCEWYWSFFRGLGIFTAVVGAAVAGVGIAISAPIAVPLVGAAAIVGGVAVAWTAGNALSARNEKIALWERETAEIAEYQRQTNEMEGEEKHRESTLQKVKSFNDNVHEIRKCALKLKTTIQRACGDEISGGDVDLMIENFEKVKAQTSKLIELL
eukprot:TRINITY_DN134_c0_g1_i1.p1 TRINITY_DN134_c0_g1~~TRINITY_DN134_c0_g1_i1.p1  ORF type:complete len:366 (-),score=107.68 TRINITY_DN134_c0_g1_i1:128-1192(-)